MRYFICFVFCLSIFTVAFLNAAEKTNKERPNILLIFTDDIGWGDFKCYNPSGKIETPAIDRLAATGMRFTAAHSTSAVCAPSRYSILTGNYPWRGRHPEGTWDWYGETQFLPGQKTFGHFLQSSGYRTAMFGKANLGMVYERMIAPDKPDYSSPLSEGPIQWGFDYSYIIPRGHQHCLYAYYENNVLVGDPADIVDLEPGPYLGGKIGGKGPGMKDWDSVGVGRRLTEKAVAFIDDHLANNLKKGDNRPFAIHFNTDGAHDPWTPPETLFGRPLKNETKMSEHTDMILETDIILDYFVRVLKERNLYDNTLIIITSDNGGIRENQELRDFGHDACGGLKGQKAEIWEGGHRVPLIIHWGDDSEANSKIKPGSVSEQVVGLHDLVPTFCEIAGVKPDEDQILDGVSLLPILFGQQDTTIPFRKSLLVQARNGFDAQTFSKNRPPEFEGLVPHVFVQKRFDKAKKEGLDGIGHAVIIDNRWKMMFNLTEDMPEFFADLEKDPTEKRDLLNDPLYAKQREIAEKEYRRIRVSQRSVPLL